LNSAHKSINGSKIHLLGVAYKRDVGDVRESPALDILELLRRRGAILTYTDPYVPRLPCGDALLESEWPAKQKDCAIICTNHSSFDYDEIVARFPLIVDSRNALKNRKEPSIFRL
jgi:UDP-N-acetyl-D-glucosamine dehydrogenase